MTKREKGLSAEDVLQRARLRLDDARLALANYQSQTKVDDRLRSMRYLVRDTREITFALLKLSGVEGIGSKWDEWYAPYSQEMASDPLLRAFVNLRNYYEKQGGVSPGGVIVSIDHLNTKEIRYYFLPPAGASGFFIGDHLGRSGWEISRPNGKIERRYVELPSHWGIRATYRLRENPETHFGQDIRNKPIEDLADLVISYFERMLEDAEAEFSDT